MKILLDGNAWRGRERRDRKRLLIERLRKIRISDLRKRLLIYFFLTAFVSLSVGVQLIYEVGNDRLLSRIAECFPRPSQETAENAEVATTPEMEKVARVLNRLQHRMILVMGIVLLFVIATIVVFIRNIVDPLDVMRDATKRMAEGHLDETIPIRSNDEIGKIAELINDLATNLQEILLHVWNHTSQDIHLLDRITERIEARPDHAPAEEVMNEIAFVRRDIEDMRDMVRAFDFYNIHLEGEKVVKNDLSPEDYRA